MLTMRFGDIVVVSLVVIMMMMAVVVMTMMVMWLDPNMDHDALVLL